RVAQTGPGLDVVEPDVLHARPVGPRLLAGHRAGVAADALVQVHHHGHLRHDLHADSLPSCAATSVLHRCGALADHRDLVPVVTGRADVVELVGELGVAADDVAGLDHDPGHRVVDAATFAVPLGQRHVDQPVLGVVHLPRALRHPVADHSAGGDHPVAVGQLDPVVVGDTHLGRVPVGHPHRLPTTGEAEHEQVVLVLGVDRPLVVRGEVAHRDTELVLLTDLRLAEQLGHVQRRPVHRQRLTHRLHPVVVQVEVLAPGEGVERFEVLDVDGERGVPPPAALRTGPLRGGDHRYRCGLDVGEADPLALVLTGQVVQVVPA